MKKQGTGIREQGTEGRERKAGTRDHGPGTRDESSGNWVQMAAYRVVLHSPKGCLTGYKTCEMAAQVVVFRVDMYLAGSLFEGFGCSMLN